MFFGREIGGGSLIIFPSSTELNKRIPKEKFYSKLSISKEVKKLFVEQIDAVHWANKISPSTTNLKDGREVEEIEIFRIRASQREIDRKVLETMDKSIPYHILFIVEHGGQVELVVGYKEKKCDSFSVRGYYSSGWMDEDEAELNIKGFDMDSAYEGFVAQIAGERLKLGSGESLKSAVEKAEEMAKLEKKIAQLKKRLSGEKQFNRQMKLNDELKSLKREMEGFRNG